MHLGFTGTQIGCEDAQVKALARLLVELAPSHLHHGDCVGADELAHRIARAAGISVELHPPTVDAKRAFCEMLRGEVTRPPADYLVRNRAIVNATAALLACPREEEGETLRSGTWATVRYARSAGRPVYIVRPSGRIERHRT